MATKNKKQHYYMGAALSIYQRDGVQKQRHMNMVMELDEKKITASVLDQARQAILQRTITEGNLPPDAVNDIIFLNWTHLGFMSQKEFEDLSDADDTNPYH